MKKVVFLGDTLINDEPLGIQRYAYQIIKEIDNINPKFNIEILIPQNKTCKASFRNIKVVSYGKITNSFLWRQICFPVYVKKEKAIGIDMTLGLPILGCQIVCLHDCIYENYPQNFITLREKVKRYCYLFRVFILTKIAKQIVTVSQNSKKELEKHYHISPKKIRVVYNSWQHYREIDSDYKVFHEIGINEKSPFFFSLGSALRHKNLKWIVCAALQNNQTKFVVTGTNRLSSYLVELGIEKIDNVIFTGFLSDGKVKALMEHCTAFIHPSFYEGFGIPPLEALSCGANIVLSSTSCLPEIYGKSAIYINPSKYENINMDQIMKQKVENSKNILEKYSWKKSAKKFIKIIQNVIRS